MLVLSYFAENYGTCLCAFGRVLWGRRSEDDPARVIRTEMLCWWLARARSKTAVYAAACR